MVFKLGNILKQVKTHTSQNEAVKRPFDIKVQLDALDTSSSTAYNQETRDKRQSILKRVSLPLSTLRIWIREEMEFIQQQQQSNSSSLDFLQQLSDVLIGSELGIAIDTFLIKHVASSTSTTQSTDNDNDQENNLDEDEAATNNINNNNNLSKENRKLLSVAGQELLDIFATARSRNGNHFLENHKFFIAFREAIEENKATEENGDHLDDVIRWSYKIQLLGSGSGNSNNNKNSIQPYPSENVQEILQEYKDWELDEDVKSDFVSQVAIRYGFVDELSTLNKNQNNDDGAAADIGKSGNKVNSSIQFLNTLRTKKELEIMSSSNNNSAELWKNYSTVIERKEKADQVNKNWFSRSLYVLMRGIQSIEEKLDSCSDSGEIESLAEGGFELLQEMISLVSSAIQHEISTSSSTTNSNSKHQPQQKSLLDDSNSFMNLFPLSKFSNWIVKHFELFFYFSITNKVASTEQNETKKTTWCQRRISLCQEMISFFFFSTKNHNKSATEEYVKIITTEYLRFVVDEAKECEQFLFSLAFFVLSWSFLLSTSSFSLSDIPQTDLDFVKNRPLEICEGGIVGDDSLEDSESALLLPSLYQCCSSIAVLISHQNNNDSPIITNGNSLIKKHLQTADAYLMEKNLPLQSFIIALTAFSKCFRNVSVNHISAVILLNSLKKYKERVCVVGATSNVYNEDQNSSNATNDDRRRQREEEEEVPTKPKKFFIYKFPRDKNESQLRAVFASTSNVNPISIEFAKSKRSGASSTPTTTVIVVLKGEDCIATSNDGIPSCLTSLESTFPGISFSEEKSDQHPNTNVVKHQQPQQQQNAKNQQGQQQVKQQQQALATNDDFAAMLG